MNTAKKESPSMLERMSLLRVIEQDPGLWNPGSRTNFKLSSLMHLWPVVAFVTCGGSSDLW